MSTNNRGLGNVFRPTRACLKCGRAVTAADVAFLKALMSQHPEASRRQLSRLVCEAWNWVCLRQACMILGPAPGYPPVPPWWRRDTTRRMADAEVDTHRSETPCASHRAL